MPLLFPASPDPKSQQVICAACHLSGTGCVKDLRDAPVRNRQTTFRIVQDRLIDCAFDSFVPGCAGDPDPTRPFADYRRQAVQNMLAAAQLNFPATGGKPAFQNSDISKQALGKVDGDIFELLEAAALWNAAAAWNECMSTNVWPASTFVRPAGTIATPLRRVAIVKLPRGYDSTRLLTPDARAAYAAFQHSLSLQGMHLRLSSPDIVGLRIPEPMPAAYTQFLSPLSNLSVPSLTQLVEAHAKVEGTIEGRNFLFAIAVKTSTFGPVVSAPFRSQCPEIPGRLRAARSRSALPCSYGNLRGG